MTDTVDGNQSIPLNKRDLRRWDVFWSSFAGVGYLHPAPGTWGSAAACLVWWFVLAPLSMVTQLVIVVVYGLISWWAADRICARHGLKDASQIISDEVVGMWLALLVLPEQWWMILAAFVLFRILDIAKPGPIGWLDKHLPGGAGVMGDDVLAGLITGLVLCVTHLALITNG
ncbi:MAG: phosphatidylglycerophosphatase A [Pseudomonadota bacterium]